MLVITWKRQASNQFIFTFQYFVVCQNILYCFTDELLGQKGQKHLILFTARFSSNFYFGIDRSLTLMMHFYIFFPQRHRILWGAGYIFKLRRNI